MDDLALFGGTPVRSEFLPYGQQNINELDIEAVVKVLRSDYLTTGPNVERFEKEVAKYVGAEYAVAFSNGTAALHAACFVAGIGEGDEVITSPLTFAASANCVLYQGGRPVFADVNSETFLIDPKAIEAKITPQTKAIIPVDYTGEVVDLDPIMEIASRHNLIVIQDGAHSLGSFYKEKRVGSIADMTMFSFHPVKTITSGEGGMITTNNELFYKRLKLFRTHGITRDKNELLRKTEGPWYYEQQQLGFNYRLTDLQCALGVSQLNRIEDFKQKRSKLVEAYDRSLKDVPNIILQKKPLYSDSCRHLYIVRFDLEHVKASRNEIFQALRAENIGVNVHYIPVYMHPYYQKMGYSKGLCPKAETIYRSLITLPLHVNMDLTDVEDVVTAIKKVLNYYKG